MRYIMSLIAFFYSQASHAHVKWFSDYSFDQVPLNLSSLNHTYFWGLFALSLISLPLLIWVDEIGDKSTFYSKFNQFFDRYSDQGPLIMRVTMGAVLLMSWQGDSIIAPEITITSPFCGWLQFIMALLLLFKETSIITGLGMMILYFIGIKNEGLFHMLDYMVYPAVGLYLVFSNLKNERFRNLDLPVLYSGLGFSLCWVAFEKMIYPFWGLAVLDKAPALTMGLPHDFFLLSCAFIEFTLGYLLIICLLHRPLAATITIVFFITTSFFGKTEVVGHTILHGALLVFIVRGPGHHYTAPIRFHKSLLFRNAFAIVNFIILFAVMAFPYEKMAKSVYEESMSKRNAAVHQIFEVPASGPVPKIMIHPMRDEHGGWNLHLMTENFKFLPATPDREDVLGEGHAHLYVNGKKVGRLYSEWSHITLPSGTNKVKVTINTNSHKDYFYNGEQVMSEVTLSEDRDVKVEHAH